MAVIRRISDQSVRPPASVSSSIPLKPVQEVVLSEVQNVLDEFLSLYKDISLPPLPHLIRPLLNKDWLKFDTNYDEDIQEREKLSHTTLNTVFHSSHGSKEGEKAVLDLILQEYPECFQRKGNIIHNLINGKSYDLNNSNLSPFFVASQLVQEDLCLLKRGESDKYTFVSGAVYFPTAWHLEEKIDQGITKVHENIDISKELQDKVEGYLKHIKVDKPGIRFNPLIFEDPTLYQPSRILPVINEPYTQENIGNRLWLRTERQTLRRLPGNEDYILFTIRVYNQPLNIVERYPNVAKILRERYKSYPPNQQPAYIDPLLAYLQKTASLIPRHEQI